MYAERFWARVMGVGVSGHGTSSSSSLEVESLVTFSSANTAPSFFSSRSSGVFIASAFALTGLLILSLTGLAEPLLLAFTGLTLRLVLAPLRLSPLAGRSVGGVLLNMLLSSFWNTYCAKVVRSGELMACALFGRGKSRGGEGVTARMVECAVEGRTGDVGTEGGRGRK